MRLNETNLLRLTLITQPLKRLPITDRLESVTRMIDGAGRVFQCPLEAIPVE